MILLYKPRNYFNLNSVNHWSASRAKRKLGRKGYRVYTWPEEASFFQNVTLSQRAAVSLLEIHSAFQGRTYDALLINTDMLSVLKISSRYTVTEWKKLFNIECDVEFHTCDKLLVFLKTHKGKLLANRIGI